MEWIYTFRDGVLHFISQPIVQRFWWIIAWYALSFLHPYLSKGKSRPKNQYFIPSYLYFVLQYGPSIFIILLLVLGIPIMIVLTQIFTADTPLKTEFMIIAFAPFVFLVYFWMWKRFVISMLLKVTNSGLIEYPYCPFCKREFSSSISQCRYCRSPLTVPVEGKREYYQYKIIERVWSGVWIEVFSVGERPSQPVESVDPFTKPVFQLFAVFLVFAAIFAVFLYLNMFPNIFL